MLDKIALTSSKLIHVQNVFFTQCIRNRQPKIAEQLRKEFKMSDQLFWWAKVKGLAIIGEYDELEKFCKSRKSPIGYEPFAEACLRYGNRREASKYVARVPPENRFDLYMKIEDYPKAAETAFQNRSIEQLDTVQLKAARQFELVEHIKALKAKLGYKQ